MSACIAFVLSFLEVFKFPKNDKFLWGNCLEFKNEKSHKPNKLIQNQIFKGALSSLTQLKTMKNAFLRQSDNEIW